MDINEEKELLRDITAKEYKEGFVTDVEQEFIPKGLNEDIVRMISERKGEPQWLLDFRLDAFRKWQAMEAPEWGHLDMPHIDYQDIIYYAAPKKDADRPKEIDPKLAETFDKLGIPLKEREVLAGVAAVDAVFDSVSVATTFRKELADKGIIFCSFSEAVKEHPDLVRKYLATVVPAGDNYFAALNSAVFSDGSFCYIPKGVRCPMELGEVAVRIEEVEDQQRHVSNMIDENIEDLKNVVTENEKYIIGRKLTHLRSKLVVLHSQKVALLNALRKMIEQIPAKYRDLMIRKLRLEKRFKAIKLIAKDVKAILEPKVTVGHKKSTKKTIKRIGHGIAKKVSF